jgi:hypothetical protein
MTQQVTETFDNEVEDLSDELSDETLDRDAARACIAVCWTS